MSKLAKDDVLAMVAHELRSPLASVLGAVHLLREIDRGEDLRRKASLDLIARQAVHMSRLVEDLHDAARVSRGRLTLRKERLDFRDPVDASVEATQPLIERRGHKLEVELPLKPIWMDADWSRLQQVVANLLINSAKYTEPGGQIRLRVETEGSFAKLSVSDTGIGIVAEALERIFEPFTQARADYRQPDKGLGIGLAVVRSVVELHGGKVEARSAGLHQGSQFIVRLPTLPD